MKTPIQELIEELRDKVTDNPNNPFFSAFGMSAIIAEKYLEKEKEHIVNACNHNYNCFEHEMELGESYYDKIYTKE